MGFKEGPDGEAKDEGMSADVLPAFFEVMFSLHSTWAMDLVRKQFRWFFKDNLYRQENLLRANALLILGNIITEELDAYKLANGGKTGSIDWVEHITEQQIKKMEKMDQEYMAQEEKYNQ